MREPDSGSRLYIVSNSATVTLFELNTLVRETLELGFADTYWVQGELSEGRAGYGGHFYGELIERDEDAGKGIVAKARVTCWATAYRRLSREFEAVTGETLRAGMKVMLEVEVSFHQQYGYSLNILGIDPSYTLGDMARRRQEILRQLEADGILHDNAELPLPLLTQRIAVISSASAAGYGDFCNQLNDNEYGFHFSLRLFPAVMQGDRVEESVIAALQQIAEEQECWDAVVIIRGGGAISDLSDFDSYPLAACIAQMPLPVITGIGHERDETVLDHVAHTHLKTPTAVAAFLIDRMLVVAARIDDLAQRITRSVSDGLAREQQRLLRLSTTLPLAFQTVRERQMHRLDRLIQSLRTAYGAQKQLQHHRINLLEQQFRSLDPQLLLQRGYSLTFTADGQLLRDVSQVVPGEVITTRLADGTLTSVVHS